MVGGQEKPGDGLDVPGFSGNAGSIDF